MPTPCMGLCGHSDMSARFDSCSDCARVEVMEGVLSCNGCRATFAIGDGVPRLAAPESADDTRPRTALSFGYLWAHSPQDTDVHQTVPYHFSKMERGLSLSPPGGLVLDAGCGDGIDLANHGRRGGVEAIGIELSKGGCLASYARTRRLARAHVVQADICRLPFVDGTFDLAYSYGVLHHLGMPGRGLREIVRVAKPGAQVLGYLYEDFSERSGVLRLLLKATSTVRLCTTRLPLGLLYALCRFGSPIVFMFFTLPAILGRRLPGLAPLSRSLPFRHGTSPFSLTGDLYDRFSAPVEWRYSRAGSVAFFAGAGLERVAVAAERGWMVSGVKPGKRLQG